jgi:hypothetical protein
MYSRIGLQSPPSSSLNLEYREGRDAGKIGIRHPTLITCEAYTKAA